MAINFQVEVQGLREVRRALRGTELYQTPYREAAEAIGALGEQLAARNAPRGRTGQLEAQIRHRVGKGALPHWVAVDSRARRKSRKYPRGYFYGRLLNYATDVRGPNRRGGGMRSNPHRFWFTGPLERLGSKIGPVLAKAASQIERRWDQVTR